jgi:hypothetical protein
MYVRYFVLALSVVLISALYLSLSLWKIITKDGTHYFWGVCTLFVHNVFKIVFPLPLLFQHFYMGFFLSGKKDSFFNPFFCWNLNWLTFANSIKWGQATHGFMQSDQAVCCWQTFNFHLDIPKVENGLR